jgi:hypothetical protein
MSTPPIRFGIMVGAGRLVAHGTVSGEFHIFKLLTFSRVGMLGGMNSNPPSDLRNPAGRYPKHVSWGVAPLATLLRTNQHGEFA